MGRAMEWPGLHFLTELPESGQVILDCTHDPFLVLLAYLVACVGSFATLDMAERVAHAEKSASKTLWRWVGSGCLAGGIWAMHFVGMLAFRLPIPIDAVRHCRKLSSGRLRVCMASHAASSAMVSENTVTGSW